MDWDIKWSFTFEHKPRQLVRVAAAQHSWCHSRLTLLCQELELLRNASGSAQTLGSSRLSLRGVWKGRGAGVRKGYVKRWVVLKSATSIIGRLQLQVLSLAVHSTALSCVLPLG